MALYFFDTRDDDTFLQDDEGVDLPDVEAALRAASASLGELARDVLPGSARRELSVEVRDERGTVLHARLSFEAVVLV
jgi:hypothetical protein